MTDRIREKYRLNNDNYFNEFIEPEIIQKCYYKKCMIAFFILTMLNTGYFVILFYFLYELHNYSKNDLFKNPDKTINFINNMENIVNNICNNNDTKFICI